MGILRLWEEFRRSPDYEKLHALTSTLAAGVKGEELRVMAEELGELDFKFACVLAEPLAKALLTAGDFGSLPMVMEYLYANPSESALRLSRIVKGVLLVSEGEEEKGFEELSDVFLESSQDAELFLEYLLLAATLIEDRKRASFLVGNYEVERLIRSPGEHFFYAKLLRRFGRFRRAVKHFWTSFSEEESFEVLMEILKTLYAESFKIGRAAVKSEAAVVAMLAREVLTRAPVPQPYLERELTLLEKILLS